MSAAEKVQLFGDEPLALVVNEQDTVIDLDGIYPSDPIWIYGENTDDVHANHLRFLNTEHGLAMRGITRYSSFVEHTAAALDRDMDAANQRFREWIGPDVHLELHEPHTTRIADYVTSRERISRTASRPLMNFVVMHHDKGESRIGDIQYFRKTDADDEAEADALDSILREVFPEYTDVHIGVIRETTGKAGNGWSNLIFNAVERMGYYDSALRAWRMHREVDEPQDRLALFTMACEVAQHHIRTLRKYAVDMPGVSEYLQHTAPLYEEIVQARP